MTASMRHGETWGRDRGASAGEAVAAWAGPSVTCGVGSRLVPALRFGVCTDQNQPFATLVERWRLFEELGFDSVWDCDHFNQPSRPAGPYFEGWTLLAALAARTE